MISKYWVHRGEFFRVAEDTEQGHVTVQSVRPGTMPIRVHRGMLKRWEPLADYPDNP